MPLVRTAVPEMGLPITISQCLTRNTRGGVSWPQPFIRRSQRFRSFRAARQEVTLFLKVSSCVRRCVVVVTRFLDPPNSASLAELMKAPRLQSMIIIQIGSYPIDFMQMITFLCAQT